MSIKQISVFLENKPGELSGMTSLLADSNIDIRALSLAETSDFGIARLIVKDIRRAAMVLSEANFVASTSEVLAFAVPDEPGGLNNLLNKFNEAEVNIEYMYAFLDAEDKDNAYMIFKVTDIEKSEQALVAEGLKPLTQEDIDKI
ncbi:MAG: acetolactate synthase [Clostridia bacterium]|nr:acetolactate synthase [Clostridia bacterium]MBR5991539.1 acetolactate synthase [Clostridia bacterium]MBR6479957.1 acetolactate synthase [Clostridia bacterium]MBR6512158.1 acetolactate synthase [Clostridia bacterium]